MCYVLHYGQSYERSTVEQGPCGVANILQVFSKAQRIS
jgi:hypothetical protein